MTWLDTHAGGIQAFATVANLVVALVLAILTGRYVRLTRAIAQTSADQMRHMLESANASRKQHAAALTALATRLRTPLGELPPNVPQHDRLFHYAQLNEDDVRTVEALARGVDAEAIYFASKAAVPLHTIIGFIRYARGIALNYGWIASEQESSRWYEAHQAALAGC